MDKTNRHTKEAMFSMDRKLKYQRKQIEALQKDNQELREKVEAGEFVIKGERIANHTLSNWLIEDKKENTKLQERVKELEEELKTAYYNLSQVGY